MTNTATNERNASQSNEMETQMKRDPQAAMGAHSDAQGAQPMVKFSRVTKRYGTLTVLDELDFEIRRNESMSAPSSSCARCARRFEKKLLPVRGHHDPETALPIVDFDGQSIPVLRTARFPERLASPLGVIERLLRQDPDVIPVFEHPSILAIDEQLVLPGLKAIAHTMRP